jgi:hypothetical protein
VTALEPGRKRPGGSPGQIPQHAIKSSETAGFSSRRLNEARNLTTQPLLEPQVGQKVGEVRLDLER